MYIRRFDISAVRNIELAKLDNIGRINVIYGENGSGKTSILEALHLLCLGRTFRSHQFRPVISEGAETATVFCEAFSSEANAGELINKNTIGVSRGRRTTPVIRINGSSVSSLAALVGHLPIQLLNADSFLLIEGASSVRRQFMDWGVFHVEHSFNSHWQMAKKCIKQRNSLLRRGKINPRELEVWDHELSIAGEKVDICRQRYIEGFTKVFQPLAERVTGISTFELRYKRGWPDDESLSESLVNSLERDERTGYTNIGPQRADLKLLVGGRPAAEVLSRGQEKILVCALRLAQAAYLKGLNGKDCAFLIDDLPAELDLKHRKLLCEELERLSAQVFITCIDVVDLGNVWSEGVEPTMFHVEHGEVRRA